MDALLRYILVLERQAMNEFPRITQNPVGGRPCIRGMRVTVGMIVGQIGAGQTIDDIFGRLSLSRSARASLRPLAMRLGALPRPHQASECLLSLFGKRRLRC
jgi:hypothetical protein